MVAAVALLAGAGCRALQPPTAVVGPGQPLFSASGPDAIDYGATADGFQRADAYTFWRIPHLVDSHSRMDEIFPARLVARPAWPSTLRRAAPPTITYRFRGEERTLDDYLARHPATGLLIARGDTIFVERYQYGRRDTHRFTSWSMGKTLTAMLVGIAIEEGRIRSIDDHPAAYVPELAGTEYGRTPIRHLLNMASGVRFREEYTPDDDVTRLVIATYMNRGPGGPAAVTPFNDRAAAPGVRFYYASSETQVLGLVLRAATGRPVADYLSEKIWQPMGAEADATWLMDKAGQEATFCCVNAVLRDYARLGLLLAADGRRGDRQIIPRRWLLDATSVSESTAYLHPRVATPFFGYGYQTWIFPGDRRMFALLGVRGQAIYVDPASGFVLVHTAVRKLPVDPAAAELGALWAGVRAQLGG